MAQDYPDIKSLHVNHQKMTTGSNHLAAYFDLNGGSTTQQVGSVGVGRNSNGSNSPSMSPKNSPLHTSNDTLNSSASVSSGVGSALSSSVSSLPSCGSPANNLSLADYLGQLIKDKKQLSGFQHIFFHVERLLDEEINKVRVNLFQLTNSNKDSLSLPEPEGQPVTLTQKIFVPTKEYPDFNFVGRILGPRGMTAKQLEKETGCKIMIRGKGSMRDKQKEAMKRGTPNWEHLNEELHVLIQVEDTADRAQIKLSRAVEEINKLLIPLSEAEDELKKRQLMELAIINGTYRDNSANHSKAALAQAAASQYLLDPARLSLALAAGQLRQPTLGTPLVLPARGTGGNVQFYSTPGNPMTDAATAAAAAAAGLFYSPFDYSANLAASLLSGEYHADAHHGSMGGFHHPPR